MTRPHTTPHTPATHDIRVHGPRPAAAHRARSVAAIAGCAAAAAIALGATAPAQAQVAVLGPQVQIPSLQVCDRSALEAPQAVIGVDRRMPGGFAGTATLRARVRCDPIGGVGYPAGTLGLYNVDMNDTTIPQGADIVMTSFEQVTSSGTATPTLWLNGRCEVRKSGQVLTQFNGCRLWLMVVDNRDPQQTVTGKTADVVSFMVVGKLGRRIAYGTGPVVDGDLVVNPTGL